MKIAYIHNQKLAATGASHINNLIVSQLQKKDVEIQSYYPKFELQNMPVNLQGVNKILLFFAGKKRCYSQM